MIGTRSSGFWALIVVVLWMISSVPANASRLDKLLSNAVFADNHKTAKLLLERGASPNASSGVTGQSVLWYAGTVNKSTEMVALLFKHGGDLGIDFDRPNMDAPWWAAIQQQDWRAVEAMAPVVAAYTHPESGLNLLHVLAYIELTQGRDPTLSRIESILVAAGCDLDAASVDGITARDLKQMRIDAENEAREQADREEARRAAEERRRKSARATAFMQGLVTVMGVAADVYVDYAENKLEIERGRQALERKREAMRQEARTPRVSPRSAIPSTAAASNQGKGLRSAPPNSRQAEIKDQVEERKRESAEKARQDRARRDAEREREIRERNLALFGNAGRRPSELGQSGLGMTSADGASVAPAWDDSPLTACKYQCGRIPLRPGNSIGSAKASCDRGCSIVLWQFTRGLATEDILNCRSADEQMPGVCAKSSDDERYCMAALQIWKNNESCNPDNQRSGSKGF